EYRLLRHLAEASPAIRAVLSDLHGMTVGSLLGLDKYEVRYIARGDLAAWTKGDINKELRKNHAVYFDIGLSSVRTRLAPGGLKNLFVNDVPVEDGQGRPSFTNFAAELFDGDPTILEPIKLRLGQSAGP